MDFTNFTELVRLEVSRKLGDGYKVRINDVRKNNSLILTGLTILQNEINISPTIYLNGYFQEYVNGKTTLKSIVDAVMDTYNKNKIGQNVDMRYFLNFKDVKLRIVFSLINTERNKELLEDIPHIDFLDLSIVFQCLISQEELGLSTVLIHNVHIKLWDVTAEELYQIAKENTPRLLPCELKSMNQVLSEIMIEENPEAFSSDDCSKLFAGNIPMFVLSNRSRVEGAACILYTNLLVDFSGTINSSFYIIPSSTHEVLLLPTKNDAEYAEIKNMIKEINDTQVSAEEILSYSLYYFDRETGKISML